MSSQLAILFHGLGLGFAFVGVFSLAITWAPLVILTCLGISAVLNLIPLLLKEQK
jgi:hypothetical protein